MTQATCTRCGTTKPASEFYRKATKRNGLEGRCKACKIEVVKAYNAKRRAEYPRAQYVPSVCVTCGESYTPHRKDQRYCSSQCHRKRREIGDTPVVCAYCFKTVLKTARQATRYPVSFCDKRCAGRYKKRPTKVRRGRELVGPVPRRQIEHQYSADGVWLGSYCAECGDAFLTRRRRDRFCTAPCAKRNQRRKYKTIRSGHLRGVKRETIDLPTLAKRDGWRCHICKRKVSRRTWSVDHLVPTSYGGEDTYANVALAHHRCNSIRGNRGAAQLLLVA
jgi:5-methylcytosine-specific restriction endonuclease McrA